MKFALSSDKQRIEAVKGAKGTCPCCGEPLIAKCGRERINHWSHKGNSECSLWKEKELPWHRNWKNQFPLDWQEKIFFDSFTGEKHIADVCTDFGFVIEFQHSPISEEEKLSREKFYKNMCWVADMSSIRQRNRFFKRGILKTSNLPGYYYLENPCEVIPVQWNKRNSFVFLDFKGDSSDVPFDNLFCLIPTTIRTVNTLLISYSRSSFIEAIRTNNLPSFLNDLKNRLDQNLKERAERWHLI